MHKSTIRAAKELCRTLRKNQTAAETLLWNRLRNRNLLREKFLRQHPIYSIDIMGKECFYIADFYCHQHQLVIEIDGKIHDYQYEYDAVRTEILNGFGLTVIRFKNEEIENDMEEVLKKIIKFLQ